jgi:septin family protein
MRRMHRKVNIVPVIAKADTLTSAEIKRLKDRIMADIEDHKIQVYISNFFGKENACRT